MVATRELEKILRRKKENQELSLREFAEKKPVLTSRPSKVLIELTQNCNFKCLMCNQSWEERYRRYDSSLNMPLELFDKIAHELFPDAYFVDLRGVGETTLLPQWPEVVDRLDAYPGINWHLVTNLSFPKAAVWEKMIASGFQLGFSCDGATKETFEKIRVKSKFDRILENLGVISSAIKSQKKGHLYFITVVQRANLHELARIVELASRYGVEEVQFKKVRDGDGYKERLTAAEQATLKSSLSKSVDTALDLGVRLTINDQELLDGLDLKRAAKAAALPGQSTALNLPESKDWSSLQARVRETFRVSERRECFKPFHYTVVLFDGKVGTCNHMMMNPDILEMGDLSKQSFEEIWNGEAYQFFRASLAYNKPMDRRCQWCFKHRLED